MTDPLFVDVTEHSEMVFLQMEGVIDEDNRLMTRAGPFQNKIVFINLSKVSRLNSCGIRDWVGWIQKIEADNRVYFVGCSPAVITQVNMIRNFCGSSTRILSFNAPYLCETCNEEHLVLFSPRSIGEIPPPAVCETCGEAMDFDDLPDMYFSFCERVKALGHADDLASALIPVLAKLPTKWNRSVFGLT